jgi:hypothetical protein
MVAESDFSGLTSSAWALAKAEARAATVSLDRAWTGSLSRTSKLTAPDRAFASHAVSDRLFGILRHQGFELAFGPFVVEKRGPRVAAWQTQPMNSMSSCR